MSAITVTTTWTSLRRPLTNVGRSGRSIRRRSGSRPRRAGPRDGERAGIRPAAYIRSSTSTVSGKKSNCSFGGFAGRRGRQHHGVVVEVRDDGAGGLTGQPAGLEPDGVGAEAAVVDDGNGLGVCVLVGLRAQSSPLVRRQAPCVRWRPAALRVRAPACRVPVFDRSASDLRGPGRHYRGPASCGEPHRFRTFRAREVLSFLRTGSLDPVGPLDRHSYRRRPSRSMTERYRLIRSCLGVEQSAR